MKVFQWGDIHTYVGIAETVEEARELVIARIRDYHRAPQGDEYSRVHEREIEAEPDGVYDLPCGFMIVSYE